jgi:hypothetical protein
MGTLVRFGKVRLAVFGGDHGVPHVHVVGPDFRCTVAVESLEVLAGSAPARVLREARRWISLNRDMIEDQVRRTS